MGAAGGRHVGDTGVIVSLFYSGFGSALFILRQASGKGSPSQ